MTRRMRKLGIVNKRRWLKNLEIGKTRTMNFPSGIKLYKKQTHP